MSCIISIYDILSALGFRDCILDNYAFLPPEPSYTIRSLNLREKTKVVEIVHLSEDSNESGDRVHLIASSLHLGSKLQMPLIQNSPSPKLDLRQSIVSSIIHDNLDLRFSPLNFTRDRGLTHPLDEISSSSNSYIRKSLLHLRKSANLNGVKSRYQLICKLIRKTSNVDLINQKSTQFSDIQAKHYQNLLQDKNPRGSIEKNKEISYIENQQNKEIYNFPIKSRQLSIQTPKCNPKNSEQFPEYEFLLVSKEESSLYKLPELSQLSVKSYLLTSPQGNQFASVFVEYTGKQSEQVILYSHGNSCDLGLCLDILLDLAYNLSMNVFAYEYPGYGQSFNIQTARVNDLAIIEAAQTSYYFLINQMNFKWSDIIFYGYSLGSGPSVTLGSMAAFPCRGIILQSAIASGLNTVYPKKKIKSEYDIFPNIELIRFVRAPLFIMHGQKDQIAPFSCAQKMASHSKSLYEFWAIEGGDHYNLDLQKEIRDEYFFKLRDFLSYLDNEFSQKISLHHLEKFRAKPWSQQFLHIYKQQLSFKEVEKLERHHENKLDGSGASEVQLISQESQ